MLYVGNDEEVGVLEGNRKTFRRLIFEVVFWSYSHFCFWGYTGKVMYLGVLPTDLYAKLDYFDLQNFRLR